MRIISKFKDYYDVGLAHGIDEGIVFVRELTEREYKRNGHALATEDLCDRGEWENKLAEHVGVEAFYGDTIFVNRIIVGFCGKIHLCYRVKFIRPNKEDIVEHCYDADHVINFFKRHLSKKDTKDFLNNDHREPRYMRKGSQWSRTNPCTRPDSFKKDFEEFDDGIFEEYFLEKKIPIFAVEQIGRWDRILKVTHYPCLKDYEFYKSVDSYTALQELSMYISGVLGVGEPHMIDISDECMRDAKGFNNVSFKTRPNTKPNRKRKKDK